MNSENLMISFQKMGCKTRVLHNHFEVKTVDEFHQFFNQYIIGGGNCALPPKGQTFYLRLLHMSEMVYNVCIFAASPSGNLIGVFEKDGRLTPCVIWLKALQDFDATNFQDFQFWNAPVDRWFADLISHGRELFTNHI